MQAVKARETGWFWAGQEPEYLVILTLLVSLLIGGLLMYASVGRMETLTYKAVSIRYPAQWMATDEADTEARAQDMGTRMSVRLSVLYELNPQAPVTMDELVTRRTFTLGQNKQLFRVLETKAAQIRGQNAVLLSYAYVAEPVLSSYQSALPRVVRGAEYLVPHHGAVYLVSFEGDANTWQEGVIERMLASIRLH